MKTRDFSSAISSMPIIAALRGIQEQDVEAVGEILLGSGITVFEVPVRTKNAAFSPLEESALRSIRKMIILFGDRAHVAAGTVMRAEDLGVLKAEGIEVCFAPNLNLDLVVEASRNGILFVPGIETVSEAMNAISAGAKGLKIFPAVFREQNGEVTVRHTPGFVRYLGKFVSCPLIPSGDAFVNGLPASYISAGAAAINVGGQIYEPSIGMDELASRAKRLTTALQVQSS